MFSQFRPFFSSKRFIQTRKRLEKSFRKNKHRGKYLSNLERPISGKWSWCISIFAKQSRYDPDLAKLLSYSTYIPRFIFIFPRILYNIYINFPQSGTFSRRFPSNRDQLFATSEFIRPEIKPAAWPIRSSFSLYPASGLRKLILFTYSPSLARWERSPRCTVEWPESNIVAGIGLWSSLSRIQNLHPCFTGYSPYSASLK